MKRACRLGAPRSRLRGQGLEAQKGSVSVAPLNFIRGRKKREGDLPRQPKPEWLKVRAPGSENYHRLKGLMRSLGLHTVCEEANCPNIGECWHHGTATFMILGDRCTRSCGYCNVVHGTPAPPDADEPVKVAAAISTLQLDYVVVTSVDRDDLPDCGASHFARTIVETRARIPSCRLEVLIPDFKGDQAALRIVLDARPDVLNHNIETVPRLYRTARPGGRYDRALQLLDRARTYAPAIPTKSGLMVGLGEEWDDVVATLSDLRSAGCQIVTIGQYLRPSLANLPMSRYYTPAEFAELKRLALTMGFGHVESGPLVRSSYHAHEQTQAYEAAR
jgi:lipoic acid synthetase